MRLQLEREEIAEAITAATASYERYRNVVGHYRDTGLSHVVGRVGELAAERWFRSMGFPVEAHWRYPERERECDIEVARCRIEVKTWTERFWWAYGRCVAVTQVEAVAKKAGVILWTVVEPGWPTVEEWAAAPRVSVTFRGFSTVKDVRAAPVKRTGPVGRQVENHQMESMRNLDRLLDKLHGRTQPEPCPICAGVGCTAPSEDEVFLS